MHGQVTGTPPAVTAPVYDSEPVTRVTAGSTYSYQVQAHDPDGSTPGFVLADAPAGMTVNPTTGLITWSTTSTSPATAAVALYAYDPSGSFTIQAFEVHVAGGALPPVIGSLPAEVSGQEGQPIVLPVTATDPGGRALVYWAADLPGGASFDPTTHTLLWEPAYGQAGTYNDVTFYVSDGVTTVSTTVSLLIAPAPPPPVLAAPPDQTVRQGDHLRFTLQGSDADGHPVTYSSTDLPENATLDPDTGVFDWPIGYDQAGTLNVSFTATSASGVSTTQVVTYTVLAAPAAPAFTPLQSWQVAEGQPISFVAMAVNPHNPTFVLPTRLPDGSLSPDPTTQPTVTYAVSGLPPGASFDPDTALFSWTPGNDQAGTYDVTFTATNDGDGGPLSTSVVVPIVVTIVNHSPVVTPIADITIAAGQPFDQAVMATDPDGNPLTLSVQDGIAGYPLPGFVTLTDDGDGSGILHFDPPAGNRGTYTLTVSATDNGDGLGAAGVLTGSTTFIVTVQSATQLPVISDIGDKVAVIGRPFAPTIQAAEADQDNLTYSVSGLPAAATLTPDTFYGTATLDWTPTAADTGSYQVTFTVTDTGNKTTQPSFDHADDRPRRPGQRHGADLPGDATLGDGRGRPDPEPAGHRHQGRGRPAHLHGHRPALGRDAGPRDRRADLDAPARPGRQVRRRGDRRRRQPEPHRDRRHHRHPHQLHTDVHPPAAAVRPRGDRGPVQRGGRRRRRRPGPVRPHQSARRLHARRHHGPVHLDARLRPGGDLHPALRGHRPGRPDRRDGRRPRRRPRHPAAGGGHARSPGAARHAAPVRHPGHRPRRRHDPGLLGDQPAHGRHDQPDDRRVLLDARPVAGRRLRRHAPGLRRPGDLDAEHPHRRLGPAAAPERHDRAHAQLPGDPGPAGRDQRHRRQRRADRQPDGHLRRPAARAQRQRQRHGHRRRRGRRSSGRPRPTRTGTSARPPPS